MKKTPTKPQKKYDSLTTNTARVNFIMDVLRMDKIGSTIDKISENTYSTGAFRERFEFSEEIFRILKPSLVKVKEFDEGGLYTYWELKQNFK